MYPVLDGMKLKIFDMVTNCFLNGQNPIVLFQKISIPLPWKVFQIELPTPLGNYSLLVSYFHSKNLAFETPLPLEISINLPWGGYGYFLGLHISEDLNFCLQTPSPAPHLQGTTFGGPYLEPPSPKSCIHPTVGIYYALSIH